MVVQTSWVIVGITIGLVVAAIIAAIVLIAVFSDPSFLCIGVPLTTNALCGTPISSVEHATGVVIIPSNNSEVAFVSSVSSTTILQGTKVGDDECYMFDVMTGIPSNENSATFRSSGDGNRLFVLSRSGSFVYVLIKDDPGSQTSDSWTKQFISTATTGTLLDISPNGNTIVYTHLVQENQDESQYLFFDAFEGAEYKNHQIEKLPFPPIAVSLSDNVCYVSYLISFYGGFSILFVQVFYRTSSNEPWQYKSPSATSILLTEGDPSTYTWYSQIYFDSRLEKQTMFPYILLLSYFVQPPETSALYAITFFSSGMSNVVTSITGENFLSFACSGVTCLNNVYLGGTTGFLMYRFKLSYPAGDFEYVGTVPLPSNIEKSNIGASISCTRNGKLLAVSSIESNLQYMDFFSLPN